MRLIFKYTVQPGIETFTEVIPVIYDSKEKLLEDFHTRCSTSERFTMFNTDFWSCEFLTKDGDFYPPEVYTVDEWFQQVK